MKPLRSLLLSTLYPSSVQPQHGVFVQTRLRELLASGQVQAKVIAPVPWFPSTHARFGHRAELARVPRSEVLQGVEVRHPRYALLPKIGMTLAPAGLAWAMWREARALQADGFDFDVIDAHYFYPDGVAAALAARWLGKPLAITARGSDVNLIAQHSAPRSLMRWASRQAGACIGVSQALAQTMRDIGIADERIRVMRNGVDLQRFRPLDMARSRSELGLRGQPLLLSVGNLVPLKGHDLVIDALAQLRQRWPDARLYIVGGGPEKERLAQQARERGLAEAVTLVGAVPQQQLVTWYSAADALVLASSREGWPNVLLEAMACGTPVVATAVGGIPEVLNAPAAGRLVAQRSAAALAQALLELCAAPWDRAATRRHAEAFGWQETTEAQIRLFQSMVAGHGPGASAK